MGNEREAWVSPGSPEWLTIEQAADWLQVSTKTIRRYIEAGSLPAVNLGGRAIRIQRKDLDAWLETRRIEPGTSLHRQARLEGRTRAGRPPRWPQAEELAGVNVLVAQADPLLLRCNTCATTWTPELRSNGRLARRAWCCPNGCNCD
jgi:excisionase family DNA binding protein